MLAAEGQEVPDFLGQSLNEMAVEAAAVFEVDIRLFRIAELVNERLHPHEGLDSRRCRCASCRLRLAEPS